MARLRDLHVGGDSLSPRFKELKLVVTRFENQPVKYDEQGPGMSFLPPLRKQEYVVTDQVLVSSEAYVRLQTGRQSHLHRA